MKSLSPFRGRIPGRISGRVPGRFAGRAAGLALFAGAASLLAFASCAEQSPDRRPDLILIVVDTLRGDARFSKETLDSSPGLRTLLADSVLFPEAFSHAPMTLPAHTSLFSSRPPFETGVLNNRQEVREDLPLLAEWLGDHGYATHAVLSLGTLDSKGRGGLDRGFDEFDSDFQFIETADDALERMKTRLDDIDRSQPFFLFAHFSDPHEPYNWHGGNDATARVTLDGEELTTATTSDMTMWEGELELGPGRHVLDFVSDEELTLKSLRWKCGNTKLPLTWEKAGRLERTKHVSISVELEEACTTWMSFWIAEPPLRANVRERYQAEVDFVGQHLGQLVEALQAKGLYDDSILVFTSDHGEALGGRGSIGHVQTLYDEMLHVPLLVKLPAGHPRQADLERVRSSLVPHQDLVPTLLELLALPALEGQRGASILAGGDTLLIAETHKPEARRNLVCFRDAEFKLVFDADSEEFEMYDLAADPEERRNVFPDRAGERAEWVERLRAVARTAEALEDGSEGVDDETRNLLDALGYGGGD